MALLVTILSTLRGAGINATAFGSVSLGFSMLRNDGAKECKRHDLAEEKLQRARDKWNEDRMKRLDFIKKRLREKNEARAYIITVNEAMLECYCVFAKTINTLPPEPVLSVFYHPSEIEKMAHYYLLQLVRVLQHMPCISTLIK